MNACNSRDGGKRFVHCTCLFYSHFPVENNNPGNTYRIIQTIEDEEEEKQSKN